jgi:hypothetical protein
MVVFGYGIKMDIYMYFSWYVFEGIKNAELRIMNVALRAMV